MLWNASAMIGYAVGATDGTIGTVSDLIVNRTDWTIHSLVVDTGNWLSGRRVLLPVSVLGQPDPDARQFPVNLTRPQIEQSPDIDKGLMAATKAESPVLAHNGLSFGRDSIVWGGADVMAPPVGAMDSRTLPRTDATASQPDDNSDADLRPVSAITGKAIEATDGDIGHTEDLLIDTTSWQIRYIKIHTANWLIGEKVLVSPWSVDWLDTARGIVHLNVNRKKVTDSPPYIATETVDGTYDELFHTYYGIRLARR